MALYTVNGLTIPAGTTDTPTGAARSDGLMFTVSSICQFNGFYYYVPTSETTLTGSSYTGTLYTAANLLSSGASATIVNTTAGSGTFTAGAWNFIPCTPATLVPGKVYQASVSHPNMLKFLHNYWNSGTGLGGAGGITSGPINAPTAGPTGAQTSIQQATSGAANVYANTSSGSWYGTDIQVQDLGTTLFSQGAVSNAAINDNATYTMGVEFVASTNGIVNAVWFFSPSGSPELPSQVGLYTVGTPGTLVTSNVASWSGAPGSGWVRAVLSTQPTITAGTHYKAVILKSGTGNLWYASQTGYYSGFSQVNGILTAPADSLTAQGQNSFNVGSAMIYPGASFNQNNYWIDVEVTSTGGGGSSGGFTGLVSALALAALAGSGSGTKSGSFAGAVSPIALAALAGSGNGTQAGSYAGLTALLALAGLPGSGSGTRAGTYQGLLSMLALAAPVGSGGTFRAADLDKRDLYGLAKLWEIYGIARDSDFGGRAS